MTINPPPTCTTGSEIPKKERTCTPTKYDPTSKKKLFIAIRKESALRVIGEYSLVIARKIGLPPNGSTMGNSALRIRNRFFAASIMAFHIVRNQNKRYGKINDGSSVKLYLCC